MSNPGLGHRLSPMVQKLQKKRKKYEVVGDTTEEICEKLEQKWGR